MTELIIAALATLPTTALWFIAFLKYGDARANEAVWRSNAAIQEERAQNEKKRADALDALLADAQREPAPGALQRLLSRWRGDTGSPAVSGSRTPSSPNLDTDGHTGAP